MGNYIQPTNNRKKAGVAILVSDKTDFKTKELRFLAKGLEELLSSLALVT